MAAASAAASTAAPVAGRVATSAAAPGLPQDAATEWWQYPDMPIEYLQTNPKKPNSSAHAKFEKYKHATTVAEARAAGAVNADCKHDWEHKYVTIRDREDAENVAMGDVARNPSGLTPETKRTRLEQVRAKLEKSSPLTSPARRFDFVRLAVCWLCWRRWWCHCANAHGLRHCGRRRRGLSA